MGQYRSALGKMVDMTSLMSKNEHVRAVGNMKVNARGDDIDSHGRVIKPVTAKVGAAYQKTVGNRAANLTKKEADMQSAGLETDKVTPNEPKTVVDETDPGFFNEELESADEAVEIERIKAAELAAQNVKIKPASEAPEFFEPTTSKKK
jgi:hypothetical protein